MALAGLAATPIRSATPASTVRSRRIYALLPTLTAAMDGSVAVRATMTTPRTESNPLLTTVSRAPRAGCGQYDSAAPWWSVAPVALWITVVVNPCFGMGQCAKSCRPCLPDCGPGTSPCYDKHPRLVCAAAANADMNGKGHGSTRLSF